MQCNTGDSAAVEEEQGTARNHCMVVKLIAPLSISVSFHFQDPQYKVYKEGRDERL